MTVSLLTLTSVLFFFFFFSSTSLYFHPTICVIPPCRQCANLTNGNRIRSSRPRFATSADLCCTGWPTRALNVKVFQLLITTAHSHT